MSFFDESDEPRTEIRSPARGTRRPRGGRGAGSGGGSRGSGGGSGGSSRPPRRRPERRPDQAILVRRALLFLGLLIIVVLIAVGVDSCESSSRRNALRDYAGEVNGIVNRSDATSSSLFRALGGGGSDGTAVSQSVNQTEATAAHVLAQARGLSAPSAAGSAQSHLVLALQMRLDGITRIAGEIQAALGTSVRTSAVNDIAAQMARFYASDVVYKQYALPELAGALHGGGIAVGGEDGAPLNGGQFLPSVQWLTPSYVASQLGVALSGSSGSGTESSNRNGTGGLRGHSLTSVSENGTALSTATENTIASSPAPTFTLDFANGGNFNEFDVTCSVKVTDTSDAGTKVVSETYAHRSATCAVTLSSPPPKGEYTVTATIEKVPGESNLDNNTLSFPVTFN